MRNLLLTIMLLGAVSVFLLFWLSPPEVFLQQANNSHHNNGHELPEADSYMLNISKIDFDKDGHKVFSLTSIETRHFQQGNRMELEQPRLISFNREDIDKSWHLNANKGAVLKGGERAIFTDNVYAWQNLDNDKKNELRTTKLIIFPQQRTAKTDKQVTMTTPNGNTVGVGMDADLNTEIFKLHSNVKGVHHVN